MKRTVSPHLIATALLCAGTVPALAQANVIENQSAFLYVSDSAGSDANPGTLASPFKTVMKAISKAQANSAKNIGTKVEIEPGVYHEYVQVGWSKYNPTLTIEATQVGQAIIDGADVYTGWYQGTGNSAIYTHSFSSLGANPVPTNWPTYLAPVIYRREMVFVNNLPLTQVMAMSEMQEGTFYVDDSSHAINIWPALGTDMTTATVEVAARPFTLLVHSRDNVAIRGLVLEHAATYMNQDSAFVANSHNVLVDQVQAIWNNWGGFGFGSVQNVTLQNSLGSHNGGVGLHTARSKQVLVQFDESDYNNWRGAQGAFYDYGMGGFKFFTTHGATVNQLYAYNNGAEGLWFDTDNRQITVSNSILSGNNDTNLQVELNHGPISLNNNESCFGTLGVNLVNSENVSFTGNKFYGNGEGQTAIKPQIYLAGAPGGRHFNDWETGTYYNVISQNITMTNNIVEDAAVGEELFSTYLRGNDWSAFKNSLVSSNNTWYDWNTAPVFHISGGKVVDFQGWKSDMGQDLNSVWQNPRDGRGCAAPASSSPDFAIYVDATGEWAKYTAHKGQAVVTVQVKNYSTTAPVTLSVMNLPSGINGSFATANVPASPRQPGSFTPLTLSGSGYHGTVNALIVARAGSVVHTVQVPVTF